MRDREAGNGAVQRIYSRNAAFQKFEVLKTNRNKRHRYGEFFVEGVRNLNEAVRSGWTVRSFLYSFETPLSHWAREMLGRVRTERNYELTDALMAGLSGKSDASELMAVIRMREEDPSRLALGDNPLLALFDRPSNRGNLGTMLRSCDALGVEALVLTGHGVDLYDPDVVVSSMGSFFRVPAIHMDSSGEVEAWIAALRRRYPRLRVIGTTSHAERPLFEMDLSGPVLFLIGNETEGLCARFKEWSDEMATIPMAEGCCASSFNVSCASTVLFYEAVRQRRLGPPGPAQGRGAGPLSAGDPQENLRG